MELFVLLILAVFASEKKENGAEDGPENGERFENNENNSIVVKIEEEEYVQVNKKSKYIGVTYHKNTSKWSARRWSKNEHKQFSNGHYDDEETAAHASDTLARKLMENGEQDRRLNFPDDHTKVFPKEIASKYIGVSYNKDNSKWEVRRWSKNENKVAYNGYYGNEETAAHASDTLARELMKNGEDKLKFNFPDDGTEVYPEKKSKYIGAFYNKNTSKWCAQRWSKDENTNVFNGYYDDVETAAHASDTLARNLMKNGDQNLKLNFPDDYTEVYREENQKKRKRPKDLSLGHPQNN